MGLAKSGGFVHLQWWQRKSSLKCPPPFPQGGHRHAHIIFNSGRRIKGHDGLLSNQSRKVLPIEGSIHNLCES